MALSVEIRHCVSGWAGRDELRHKKDMDAPCKDIATNGRQKKVEGEEHEGAEVPGIF